MMTEEEAKTKWCPFARTVERWKDDAQSYPRNRVFGPVEETEAGITGQILASRLAGCNCIASECMAWRWVEPPGPMPPDGPEPDDRGWCGLAGEPK